VLTRARSKNQDLHWLANCMTGREFRWIG
jgi:hypothetical protein